MKAYAEKFYKGKQWKAVRLAYLKGQHFICERCGMPATMVHHKKYITPNNINDVNITLNFENLEALCEDCHNKEHHKKIVKRYAFTPDGKIIPSAQEYNKNQNKPTPL